MGSVDLRESLLLLNREELKSFIADLMTPSEIRAYTERWKVACLLYTKNASYRIVHNETGVSVATITRVARFLRQEKYRGYVLCMSKLIDKEVSLEKTDFVDGILVLKNTDECKRFLSDLCTPPEIISMEERLEVAYMLYVKKMHYADIHNKIGVSVATITRVARFLQHEGNNGYKVLFSKLKQDEKNLESVV